MQDRATWSPHHTRVPCMCQCSLYRCVPFLSLHLLTPQLRDGVGWPIEPIVQMGKRGSPGRALSLPGSHLRAGPCLDPELHPHERLPCWGPLKRSVCHRLPPPADTWGFFSPNLAAASLPFSSRSFLHTHTLWFLGQHRNLKCHANASEQRGLETDPSD